MTLLLFKSSLLFLFLLYYFWCKKIVRNVKRRVVLWFMLVYVIAHIKIVVKSISEINTFSVDEFNRKLGKFILKDVCNGEYIYYIIAILLVGFIPSIYKHSIIRPHLKWYTRGLILLFTSLFLNSMDFCISGGSQYTFEFDRNLYLTILFQTLLLGATLLAISVRIETDKPVRT